MAFAVTREPTTIGHKRGVFLVITPDSAEGAVSTGLSIIDGFVMGGQDIATAAVAFIKNKGTTGTAANGTLGISGVVSGEVYHVICYGK
jgi:hypothetical protein